MSIEGHLHDHVGELSIGLSLLFGAMHALEPGHGKTALVAHLLTEKKSFLKPILLALSTAISHATSIFVIALIAHGLLHFALHDETSIENINHYLHLGSGFLLLGLGIFIIFKIKKGLHFNHQNCGCKHHVDSPIIKLDLNKSTKSWRTIALGFAVGLLPCPSALVALSGAITSGHIMSGALIVAAFSIGIFIALLSVGLLLGWRGAALIEKNTWLKQRPHITQQIQGAVLMFVGAWHLHIAIYTIYKT